MKYQLDPLSPTGVSPINPLKSTEIAVGLSGGSSTTTDILPYITGTYYDCAINSSGKSTIAGVANRIQVMAFIPPADFSIDRVGIDVTTGVASATARICIYASDATDALPGTRLYDSAEIDCSASAYLEETMSFSFTAGVLYWVGVHHSSTATLRGIATAACLQISVPGSLSSQTYNIYRRDIAYGTDSPDPMGTVALQSAVVPQVKFRVA